MATMQTTTVTTRFADIAVRESAGIGPAVLLIHGNSSCKEIFQHQFDCPLAREYRLIAIDLPGHGASSDAHDPASGYVLSGYAQAAVEVLQTLGVARAAVFGWSLGGHVGLDMISRFPGLAGVMISGAAPVRGGLEGLAQGFHMTPDMALASAAAWSEADAERFASIAVGPDAAFEPFMLAAARRTDPRAREIFFADVLAAGPDDQRQIAETARAPIAVVNGSADPFVIADYFKSVRFVNLWHGQVYSLPGVGHAPFWQAPDQFNPLLERFVAETAE